MRGFLYLRATTKEQRTKALQNFPIGDVWGIGRKARTRLESSGVRTALDFAIRPSAFAYNLLRKPVLMTWHELNGKDVLACEDTLTKQSITTSRTFATAITNKTLLEQQIANFCAQCAKELRLQGSVCQRLQVYAHPSRFREEAR